MDRSSVELPEQKYTYEHRNFFSASKYSSKGIGVIFLITGMMGFGLGSMLSLYLALPNGPQIIATAFGGTGIIFLGLSGYALTSKRDFSFMGGFLATGLMVVVFAALGMFVASLFGVNVSMFSVALSGAIVLLMSGFILFDTSRILNGGETNYLSATLAIYLSVYNVFANLLMLLGIFGGDE